MPIQCAVQRGSYIAIYGEHGAILGNITAANPGDMLLGFTSTSVTVKKGNYINVYNEHGVLISSNPA